MQITFNGRITIIFTEACLVLIRVHIWCVTHTFLNHREETIETIGTRQPRRWLSRSLATSLSIVFLQQHQQPLALYCRRPLAPDYNCSPLFSASKLESELCDHIGETNGGHIRGHVRTTGMNHYPICDL
nr:unnamed protein product [Callosobruchus analis]